MKLTDNLGLRKPEGTDVVNIDDLNYNADVLDAEVTRLATPTQDGRMSAADKAKLDSVASELQDVRTPASGYTPLGPIATAGAMTRDMQQQLVELRNSTDSWQKYKVTQDNGRAMLPPNNNLNDIVTSGFYTTVSDTAGVPGIGGSGSGCLAIVYDANHQTQLFMGRSGNVFFYRRKSAGTWSPWIQIFTHLGGSVQGNLTVQGVLYLPGNIPVITFSEQDVGENEKRWDVYVENRRFVIRVVDDYDDIRNSFLEVTRSGATISSVNLQGNQILANNNQPESVIIN
jgi:hypothetical protein